MNDRLTVLLLIVVFFFATKPECNCSPCQNGVASSQTNDSFQQPPSSVSANSGSLPTSVSNADVQYYAVNNSVVARPQTNATTAVAPMRGSNSYAPPPACVSLPQGLCQGNCVWCHKTRICKSRLF